METMLQVLASVMAFGLMAGAIIVRNRREHPPLRPRSPGRPVRETGDRDDAR